jgi:Nif-specific regulatory protein
VAQLEAARLQLAAKNRYLRERVEQGAGDQMIGQSAALAGLRAQIQAVAASNATVLILGPSGSGKELVAREIHRLSWRHAEILAAVNCGALVESLLETELFGCKKGAFTGAAKDREGLFEVAHTGTLFLDEIGDMSPALQVKLLRVLETGELLPVGATKPRRVDVRVVAATHRDLTAEVQAGRFREDLFYRINVFPIRVPALSERREDLPLLVRHFARQFAASLGCQPPEVSEQALQLLCARDYPGNIRELANLVHRAVLLSSDAGRIEPEHLDPAWAVEPSGPIDPSAQAGPRGPLKAQMAQLEKNILVQALAQHQGNRTATARDLGITRQALLLKLNRYGINQ